MAGKERMAIFPSRANFVFIKQRILSAQKGLGLLRRKRDALEMQLRGLSKELKVHEDILRNVMQEAIFSLAKANFLKTDFKPATVFKPERADAYCRVKLMKILGFSIPSLNLVLNPPTSMPYTGLSSGGRQVERVRVQFQEALRILVSIASLRYSEKILKEAVHQNNMRVNGLDFVLIPRFLNTLNYIRDELDELEREDFYRLKCSQAKQRKKKKKKVPEQPPQHAEVIESLVPTPTRLTPTSVIGAESFAENLQTLNVADLRSLDKADSLKLDEVSSLGVDIDETIKPKKVVDSSETDSDMESEIEQFEGLDIDANLSSRDDIA